MSSTNYYHYTPSLPAGIVSVAVFVVLFAVHSFRLFKTRTWFCIPFVIGALFEIIGYLARIYGHSHLDSRPGYIVQTLFILLAPILFAASVYMFLGRLIRATGFTKLSIIRTTWLTKIFVAGDILCFLVQAVGATILTTADDQDGLDRGRAVILVGLALQLVIFGLFVLVALVFHVRVRRGGLRDKAMCNWNWETYLNLLYLVSVIITLRNVYRVVEYVQGSEGYLMTHEWSIYIFDALLMAIVLAITASWYLGKIVAPKEIQQDYEMVAGDRGTAAVPLI